MVISDSDRGGHLGPDEPGELAGDGGDDTGMILRLLDAIPFEGRVPEAWFEELLASCIRDESLPEIVPQFPLHRCPGSGSRPLRRPVSATDLWAVVAAARDD